MKIHEKFYEVSQNLSFWLICIDNISYYTLKNITNKKRENFLKMTDKIEYGHLLQKPHNRDDILKEYT